MPFNKGFTLSTHRDCLLLLLLLLSECFLSEITCDDDFRSEVCDENSFDDVVVDDDVGCRACDV